MCSGISTQDWKENSATLKTGFLCSACSSSTQQTGVSFLSSFDASVFHGFSTVVFDPLMSANDSLLTTSVSTSVLHDFSNLAIGVTYANLQIIETPPVADFNAAVSNAIFNLQDNVTETAPVADFNAAVSNTAFNLQEYIDDLSFPPPAPPLSPTNFALDLDLDIDITLPPPPYPSTNDISINNSLLFPTPPEFLDVNVDSVALFRPNLNSSSIDDTNMLNITPPGAAAIEWYHSPSAAPVSPNIHPFFDVIEDPIIRTPDRPLRELKYIFHEKCSNMVLVLGTAEDRNL